MSLAGSSQWRAPFTRCGQTTLGLSPALATRTLAAGAPADAPPAVSQTVPLLYRTVERIRRRVSAAFGAPLAELRLSDATLTRLQPVGDELGGGGGGGGSGRWRRRRSRSLTEKLAAATASGSLDVGALRGDQFCYWRPHVDQVSVDEYEYSALLYLTRHSSVEAAEAEATAAAAVDVSGPGAANPAASASAASAGGGDFTGGKLVFHDGDGYDRVVLPEPGLLVSFTSGAANLHAVQRVTRGSRFALTMWFTTRRETAAAAAAADPTHVAMQRWAASLEDADASAAGGRGVAASPLRVATPPPPLVEAFGANVWAAVGAGGAARKLPTREEAIVSAAVCTLPANDPLQRALVLSPAGRLGETLERGLGVAPPHAHAAPTELEALATPRTTAAAAAAAVPSQPRGHEDDGVVLAPPLRATLQPRVAALDALMTTLRRARAEVSAEAPPASQQQGDAFSVFDF